MTVRKEQQLTVHIYTHTHTLPAFLLVVERGEAVLVPEMRLEPARPPVPGVHNAQHAASTRRV
jgi:hypothetical protein